MVAGPRRLTGHYEGAINNNDQDLAVWADNNRIDVPQQLHDVTDMDRAAETAPEALGVPAKQVERVWRSVEHLYRSGTQPFISLGVWRNGQRLIKRSIGHVRGAALSDREPVQLGTTETPVCLFSASKAITAAMIHAVAEQGHIDLDAPVTEYVPEFGQRGKQGVTVSQLLAHRAGIPRVPMRKPDPAILFDWEAAVTMLCRARPVHSGGKQVAYHAITGGFILGEIARRATGRELPDLLDSTLRTPLGLRHFTYGMPDDQAHLLAKDAFTGRKPPWLVGMVAKRALGIEFEKVPSISTDPRFLSSIIPAGNICATADEVSQFYAMLLAGGQWNGRQVMRPETVARMIRPVGGKQIDRTLMIPVRFSEGMLLGDQPFGLYGRNSQRSYGHLGFINILCWADPDRQLAVSLLTSGKPAVTSHLVQLGRVVSALGKLPTV